MNGRTIRIVTTGIFAAMITVMTAYICHIPYGSEWRIYPFRRYPDLSGGSVPSPALCLCGSGYRRRDGGSVDRPHVDACYGYY